MKLASMVASVALAAVVPAAAQDAAPVTERTERIGLEGRRGPSLFRPGFAIGEYVGSVASRASSTRLPWQSRDMARAEFDVSGPTLGEVRGDCGGGQAHRQILWITFDRETLSYECEYAGAAPAGARLTLALSRGSLFARLQQPQRAGEMAWGDAVYRVETRRVGGLPWGGGRVMGYVISRGGVDVGAVDLNGLRPTFYLPPAGSADRDPVAVLAVSLFAFQDPANR
ncbi:MAG: hypothetical protein H2038_10280 [Brevundimonas sp.]|uniref:hypothetical protein n=1 Tax=Brevundimonas sp. TaxID=1871086 RepID=UPI001819731B|nr:hypothetical protein [Brevundimonas sp.]MBA4805026.1 hypothetical protein [Brevundimonas sp.]